ncbi:MAG: YkgJ family cysteine cluster protein [Bryobacteraceae bacterium]
MNGLVQIETADRALLASLARSMAEAVRRSGAWIVCRPGCTQCCIGPFGITQLDALRLRSGMSALASADPERAELVRARAAAYIAAITPEYPGDPRTGALHDEERLPESMDAEPCPALDPETGCCDLYEARPITCRAFGPVTKVGEDTFAACELCYEGATEEERIQCAVEVDPEGLECEILTRLDAAGLAGLTIVAYALLEDERQ